MPDKQLNFFMAILLVECAVAIGIGVALGWRAAALAACAEAVVSAVVINGARHRA